MAHAFEYRVFMAYLDLDELDRVFEGRWLWSVGRPNAVWMRRADYLGDPSVPLKTAVLDLVESRTGARPQGPVEVLTNLRMFGYCFNRNPMIFGIQTQIHFVIRQRKIKFFLRLGH